MNDLNLIEAGCGPARGPKQALVFVRKAARKVIRPWLVRLDDILRDVIRRLDDAERGLTDLPERVRRIEHEHTGLAARVEPRLEQVDAVVRSMPGIDADLKAFGAKLSSFEALHWDHVALTRRLAAIEDALTVMGESTATVLEAGGSRPLLPFPGLEIPDPRTSKVS